MAKKGTKAHHPMPHMICLDICKPDIVRVCWRRKLNEPCAKFKREALLIANQAIEKKEEIIFNKIKRVLIGEDTFDHKGWDIPEEEFLENEIFFELI